MAYDRNFGSRTGLQNRLAYWANQLSMSTTYPWVGSGLIDDLLCASRTLGADPLALFPAMTGIESDRSPPEGSERVPEPAKEYDL